MYHTGLNRTRGDKPKSRGHKFFAMMQGAVAAIELKRHVVTRNHLFNTLRSDHQHGLWSPGNPRR